jgi:hypothetical protein
MSDHERLITPKQELTLPEGKHEARIEAHIESLNEQPEKSAEQARQDVESAINSTETAGNVVKEYEAAELTNSQPITHKAVDSELKNITLNRELQHIRRQLPKRDRIISKVIHQPVIRAVSEGTSKTISRPSGLLGGGIVAFIGTSTYAYFTHHLGVPYNYLLFILFFVGGFIIGLVIEFIVWFMTHRQKGSY